MELKTEQKSDVKELVVKTPFVTRDTTIRDFIELMTRQKIDFAPVVESNVIVGVVSEKDLIKLVKAQPVAGIQAVLIREIPKDVSKRFVSEIMTSHPITIRETTSVNDAVKIMTANNLKRLIVVDENKKLMGILRAKDVFKKLSETKI